MEDICSECKLFLIKFPISTIALRSTTTVIGDDLTPDSGHFLLIFTVVCRIIVLLSGTRWVLTEYSDYGSSIRSICYNADVSNKSRRRVITFKNHVVVHTMLSLFVLTSYNCVASTLLAIEYFISFIGCL